MGFDVDTGRASGGRLPGGGPGGWGGGPAGDGNPWDWFRTHPHRGAIIVIGLCSLLAFFSLFTERRSLFFFFVLLAIAVYLIWNTPEFLRRQRVIDRWDMVIPGGNGQAELVIGATHRHIDELDPPNVELRFADLAPGMWRGLTGDTRPFLIARNATNGRITSYQMFVNVRDYGEALQTSWYLAYLPSAWQRFRGRLGLDLDLFDEQDLRASVTTVHHCFIEAVIELLNTLGQDTNINRTSKGFLGVS